MFSEAFNHKSVLVTGHTGFKGSWLCQWLLGLGAEVHGFALNPQPHEKLFEQLALQDQLAADIRADIRDRCLVRQAFEDAQPDFVFHLAAQPLVRLSFEQPVETFHTNVMGTVHVLDEMRYLDKQCTCVMVTTDKCYENREWLHAYREEDPMGGYDPYSASKGCAELAIEAYRSSFFAPGGLQRIASARAGNVIGGGDWAKDRIIPDVFRALFQEQPVAVRNKTATRPWQHVLEPLSGYLWLAANLHSTGELRGYEAETFASAFNFGPNLTSNRTVAQVVEQVLKHTDGSWLDASDPDAPHEASKLNLSIDKAFHLLGWQPTWNFEQTIEHTVRWYTEVQQGADPIEFTCQQIEGYQQAAAAAAQPWASAFAEPTVAGRVSD
ncbi:MAG: CDP-glucose 4,6-dehydratase [bacterium]|nr:CDP-glucose 4,6-dehydratase [bacterium]